MSNSLRPHGLEPARLLRLCDSPGKNTGVGCRFLLQGIFPTQRSNPCVLCFLHWQSGSLPLKPPRRPHRDLISVAFLGWTARMNQGPVRIQQICWLKYKSQYHWCPTRSQGVCMCLSSLQGKSFCTPSIMWHDFGFFQEDCVPYIGGPQPFWHQGPASWKTIFL